MTISSTTRKAGPFDGNGVTTSFPFTFKVFAAADLRVVRTAPSGGEADLVLDSDYSVSLNGDQDANPGGTVTYPVSGSPLPADWRLTLIGDIDYLQPTDITNGGGFYPQVIENALDRNVMLIQQVAEEAGRSIRVAVSDDVTTGLELPAQASRADKVLGFDANGDFAVYDTSISVRATGIEVFTATSGQTVFTTPFTYVPNASALLVFQNGAILTPGVDFTETSGTEFTLAVGATLNDTVVALAGLDVTGGVQGDQIVDGSVTAAKLASTLNLSTKTLTLPAGTAAANLDAESVTATMLESSLNLIGKTISVSVPASNDDSATPAPTSWVRDTIDAAVASVTGVQVFSNLTASASGSSPDVIVTAGAISLYNSSTGLSYIKRAVSVTINTAASGANGLDLGSIATSTWYAVWIIAKADGTTAGLISASDTSPSMPTGYIYKTRVGWIRTDATGYKYPFAFRQRGAKVSYVVGAGNLTTQRELASGSVGAINTPTWVAQSTSNFVPFTAATIRVAVCNAGSTSQMVAPNDTYSEYTGANPGFVASGIGTFHVDVPLETSNIYWASNNSTCKLFCIGWEDSL